MFLILGRFNLQDIINIVKLGLHDCEILGH